MKNIHQWFEEYGHSHQNPLNKRLHWICVPAIFFSIIALLASIPAPYLQLWAPPAWQPYLHYGTVLVLLGLLFYLRLSLPMALGVGLFSLLCLWGVAQMWALPYPMWLIALGIFVVAWIGQFVGHKIEGAKPSFLKDLQFLLIGPAWLLGFLYRRWGLRY